MVMETNLRSVLFAAAAAAVMKASEKGGKIINIASVGGLKGTSALSLYSTHIKAGVINLTKTMALEWSRYGIQTNAVCPGYVGDGD